MAVDWENVKETARQWYVKVAQFVLFQNFVFYLIASTVSGQLIGPAKYAAFLYRMFTFK